MVNLAKTTTLEAKNNAMTTYIPHNCCLLVLDDVFIVEITKGMIDKINLELQLEKVDHTG